MKNAIRVYAKVCMVLGSILISLPISYLSVNLFNKQKEASTVYAQSQIEDKIISQNLISDSKNLENFKGSVFQVENAYIPVVVPQNTVANYGYRIEIPSVGIDTTINETHNAELGLKSGVWREPTFAEPYDNSKPTVLAAHRWGEDNNSWEYREKNLFLNLPDIRNGDEVKITWAGDTFIYKVNQVEENVYVSRFDDLILYTCKDYSSDVRYFVYATRIK